MLETYADRKNEDAIAAICALKWGLSFAGLGPYSAYDKYFYKGNQLVAIAEIKDRISRSAEPVIYLDLDKYLTLFTSELTTGIKGIFIARYGKGDIYYKRVTTIDMTECKITIAGRTDRAGGKNDIRPVISIPTEQFSRLEI